MLPWGPLIFRTPRFWKGGRFTMPREERSKTCNWSVWQTLVLCLLLVPSDHLGGISHASDQGAISVTGRIVTDSGRPPTEPVSIKLTCETRSVQVVHTDLHGYFTFHLGTRPWSNPEFSASNNSPLSSSNSPRKLLRRYGNPLVGCTLEAFTPGYHLLTYTLTQSAVIGRIEVGTLRSFL